MKMTLVIGFLIFCFSEVRAKSQTESFPHSPELSQTSDDVFRFHLTHSPNSLNPQYQQTNSGNYLIHNLFRTLLQIDAQGKLIPDLAEDCHYQGRDYREVKCLLRKKLKWSDGTPLTAQDFLKSYTTLITASNEIPRADLLFPVLGAQKFFETNFNKESQAKSQDSLNKNKSTTPTFGIEVPNERTILFKLFRPSPEFIWNLAHSALSPIKGSISANFNLAQKIITNGPYSIKSYNPEKGFILEPNKFYWNENKFRPLVEVLIIPEEMTSVLLYQKKLLSFLRRLPTTLVPNYIKSPKQPQAKEFFWAHLNRFDFLGFGPALESSPHLRKALSLSLDYSEITDLMIVPGSRIGCPGIDSKLTGSTPLSCLNFDLNLAKKELALQTNPLPKDIHLELHFSAAGGSDPRRMMEWMGLQWRKNLGLEVKISAKENKIFQEQARTHPPALFRKGISPERNTCQGFLELFSSTHPEKVIAIKDPQLNKNSEDAATSQQKSEPELQKICRRGINYLLEKNYIIPLGGVSFAMLLDEAWTGLTVNPLNQLDLSDLKLKKNN